MRESDVTDDYVLGLNEPRVNKYLEVRHHLQTYDSVSSFVRINQDSLDMILWGVWYGEETKECLVGTVRLHGIDNASSSCNIGICLFDEGVWRKGLGRQIIGRVTKWAFNNNKELQTIKAGIHAENMGSHKAFLKAGYRISQEPLRGPVLNLIAEREYHSLNETFVFDQK